MSQPFIGPHPSLRGFDLIPERKRITFVLPSRTQNSSLSTLSAPTRPHGAASGSEADSLYDEEIMSAESMPSTSIPPAENPPRKPKPAPKKKQRKLTERDVNLFLRAASDGDGKLVKQYLELGMPIDASDEFEWSALMCASFEGRVSIVSLLLEAGADPQLRNSHGKTAQELAREKKHAKIVHLLRKSGDRSEPERSMENKTTETTFCKVCNLQVVGSFVEHETKISHILNLGEKGVQHPGYGISETNVGYRIMQKSGWDEWKGLGKSKEGNRFPIRTVLKRDRSGLGTSKEVPRVTHFRPFDESAVQPIKKVKKVTGKDIRAAADKAKNLEHQMRVSFAYDFDEYLKP